MYNITKKELVTPHIHMLDVYAPAVAHKATPGQFVIIRTNKHGERFPITIAGAEPTEGLVRIYVAEVGASSKDLCAMKEGDNILNFSGPLGNTAPIKKYGTVLVIGNAAFVGAQLYLSEALKKEGNKIISVISSRREEELFLVKELEAVSEEIFVEIEDGSEGHSFFSFIDPYISDKKVDHVITIGSTSMQKIISEKTRPFQIPTTVNLFPIMVDGTGMCGACRVTVAGATRFACVDGPDFNGHEVDFDE
ncbi:MAG: sulfide/dihydroorotate dehydrogenase-like FAD/NAD-binding protein, partial [Candidatus Bathyarchaeota archaeon]|nr:sulfide/dihydroorotate dehydrogenase-like FAD/NAD-binding protein [Candidatus Bathyarchaeota archaeon]